MSKIRGGILVVTGVIACPCHLPITLSLLVGVLGGTAIGSFVADNQGLIYGIATAYFVLALSVGLYLLNRKRAAASSDDFLARPVAASKEASNRIR